MSAPELKDYAIMDDGGVLTLHRADCPDVRAAADAGEPVMTMLGCARAPDDMPLHGCLFPPEEAL